VRGKFGKRSWFVLHLNRYESVLRLSMGLILREQNCILLWEQADFVIDAYIVKEIKWSNTLAFVFSRSGLSANGMLADFSSKSMTS